jgi:hypothetical protein
MPEGEIDGVRQRPVPEHNKSARCAVGLSRRRCDRTHSDTDPRLHPVLDALVPGHVHGLARIYERVFLVANPDCEYGDRWIAGKTQLLRNGKVQLPR